MAKNLNKMVELHLENLRLHGEIMDWAIFHNGHLLVPVSVDLQEMERSPIRRDNIVNYLAKRFGQDISKDETQLGKVSFDGEMARFLLSGSTAELVFHISSITWII